MLFCTFQCNRTTLNTSHSVDTLIYKRCCNRSILVASVTSFDAKIDILNDKVAQVLSIMKAVLIL